MEAIQGMLERKSWPDQRVNYYAWIKNIIIILTTDVPTVPKKVLLLTCIIPLISRSFLGHLFSPPLISPLGTKTATLRRGFLTWIFSRCRWFCYCLLFGFHFWLTKKIQAMFIGCKCCYILWFSCCGTSAIEVSLVTSIGGLLCLALIKRRNHKLPEESLAMKIQKLWRLEILYRCMECFCVSSKKPIMHKNSKKPIIHKNSKKPIMHKNSN